MTNWTQRSSNLEKIKGEEKTPVDFRVSKEMLIRTVMGNNNSV